MLIIEIKQNLLLITFLRSLYKILSSPEADELLYLLIAVLNSFFENGSHLEIGLEWISSKMSMLIWWFWADLNN